MLLSCLYKARSTLIKVYVHTCISIWLQQSLVHAYMYSDFGLDSVKPSSQWQPFCISTLHLKFVYDDSYNCSQSLSPLAILFLTVCQVFAALDVLRGMHMLFLTIHTSHIRLCFGFLQLCICDKISDLLPEQTKLSATVLLWISAKWRKLLT